MKSSNSFVRLNIANFVFLPTYSANETITDPSRIASTDELLSEISIIIS